MINFNPKLLLLKNYLIIMNNFIKPNKLTKNQFDPFFVGLFEGDGSIQVNH